ncbi:hypothetical protein ACQ4PT_058768 [Festuca glaucescens]
MEMAAAATREAFGDAELYGDGFYRGGERGWPDGALVAGEYGAQGQLAGAAPGMDRAGQNLGKTTGVARGVEIVHAVADGVSIADVIPPDANVPRLVQSFFPLGDAVGFDGHELPLFVVQVTELADGVFVGFVCNHALADGTALWDFLNSWAEIARARLNLATPEGEAPRPLTSRRAPLLERWSADGGAEPQIVLACADLSELLERSEPPPLRPRILHFSAESLALLKERARQELLAAGDTAGAAALTRGSRL